MNILIVAHDFKPQTGGVAEYTHQIAKQLYLMGDNVLVLSKNMEGDRQFDENCLYKVYRCDGKKTCSASRIWMYWQQLRLTRNLVKQNGVDIIVANHIGSMGSISYSCWLASKTLHVPYCIFAHALEINTKTGLGGKLIRKGALRGADKVFCVSSFTQNLVMKFGVPINNTVISPPGISLRDFKTIKDKPVSSITSRFGLKDKRVIFTLGRLIERKGFDMTIKAVPKILRKVPDAVYLIGGSGPFENYLRELVKEYKIEDYVIFAGQVNESEREAFYTACDVFVMPCRELENGDVEGFGIVFLEANACGKPVIGGKSGGAVDAIIDGETGLLVNPLDLNQIADSIIYLLKHPEVAQQIGEKGRQRVEKELNWDNLVLQMRKELKDLIQANKS